MNAQQNSSQGQQSPPSPVEKTMAVVQMTRIGDVLQTIQVFQELREQRPEIRLVFIGREKFARPLSFMLDQVFDKVYFIDPFNFSKGKSSDLSGFLAGQAELVERISSENINVLVNLSFSKTSAHLSKLIKAQHKLGLVTQDDGQDLATDKWSQYCHATVQSGPLNAFSLVDIYRLITGVKLSAPLEAIKAPQKDSRKIVVHPFSSHRKKNWRPEKWVEIIYKTLKTHSDVYLHLVGDSSNIPDADKIISHPLLKNFQARLFNHTGKENIEFVWNLICDSALFVGHDSMVGHLASLARTQSLTLSLGTVRPFETTPYSVGSYALAPRTKCFPCFPTDQCELLQCHADISYQLVNNCIDQLLLTGSIDFSKTKETVNSFHLSTSEIYETYATEANLLNMRNINKDAAPNLKHIYQGIGRIVWLFMFQELEEGLSYFELNDKTIQDLTQQSVGLDSLFQLCEFGKKYSRFILEEISSNTVDMLKLKEYSHKLDEIDQMSESLLAVYPTLKPIVNFLSIQKACLAGENIVQMSESAYLSYDRGSVACRLFHDLINNNIQNANQPKNHQKRQEAL